MHSKRRPRSVWRGLFWLLFWLLVLSVIGVGALCLYTFRDRSPGYQLALNIDGKIAAANAQAQLHAGFARVKINPRMDRGPVWLAGFSQHRAATAIHDDLWAVAAVIDDGTTRLGIVVLDAIGFFHDDVVTVRERLGTHLKLDYAVVCSTHNHSTPDLMGLWGPNYLQTGVDAAYREQVISAAVHALSEAALGLEPASVAFSEIPAQPDGLVTDTRKPVVFDPNIRLMHFVHQVDGTTLGSIVGWADHPETPWGQNTEITADFPGYLRDALENGVVEGGQQLEEGVGGIHLYINGAIGGLMTTSPSVTVHDPYLDADFKQPGHAKARALGRQLASRILPELKRVNLAASSHAPISIRARTIEVPVANKLFLLAPVLGVIDRGHPGVKHWNRLRTEVALLTLGEASMLCVPGEIYPELVNGGIERAPGGDFNIEPLEVPPLRELMPGKTKFVFGLANDEIGYIIPKSEWDQEPPYLYGASKPVYGEMNSVGPEAAETIHAAVKELCRVAE